MMIRKATTNDVDAVEKLYDAKIIEQAEQPDGSIVVKVIKQYNSAPVGDYLN